MSAFLNILYGGQFVIVSDSKPLNKHKKLSSPAGIITRWLIELAEYQCIIQHIWRFQNILVDYLSRTPIDKNSTDITSKSNIINKEILSIIKQDKHKSSKQCCNALEIKSKKKY